MAQSIINRFVTGFDSAFQALGASVGMDEVERLTMLVHHAMAARTRAYHTAEHVFAMCEGMNPRQTLAALFHDLVYYQLDGGFPRQTGGLLQDVVLNEDGALVLQPLAADDRAVALCLGVFGFSPGQTLPLYAGLNEFLSAVVAARMLLAHLRSDDLLAVVACIEATIPFRQPDATGHSAADRLATRVRAQHRHLYPGVSDAAVETFVQRTLIEAMKLANRDVGSFAEDDPGLFLSNTWLLIEESNAPLTLPDRYTLQEYRRGLTRMEGFLRGLDPTHIFQNYLGYPDPATMARLHATATRNIAFACSFLGAKIMSIAVVEALALCTGPDCPVSMFLGDIRAPQGRPERAEDYLPTVEPTQMFDDELLRVFEKGRTLESNHDLTSSPMTAFMYRTLGHAGTQQALAQARHMFDGACTPREFLQTLDRGMVHAVIDACSRIAVSRRAALQELAQAL